MGNLDHWYVKNTIKIIFLFLFRDLSPFVYIWNLTWLLNLERGSTHLSLSNYLFLSRIWLCTHILSYPYPSLHKLCLFLTGIGGIWQKDRETETHSMGQREEVFWRIIIHDTNAAFCTNINQIHRFVCSIISIILL